MIGAKQNGQQPPESRSSTGTKVRFLHPGRSSGARTLQLDRLNTPQLLRRAQISGARLPLTQPASARTFFPKNLLKTELVLQCGYTVSNRFWLTNRIYRKQKTRPRLTGSRFAYKDFRFSALFTSGFDPRNRKRSPLNRTKISRPNAAKRGVRACHLYVGRMLLLPGETATNGLHRTYPE
jgi:hypothetical protein